MKPGRPKPGEHEHAQSGREESVSESEFIMVVMNATMFFAAAVDIAFYCVR
jgi:hypothetical protein